MQIIDALQSTPILTEPVIFTFGNFDGVHLGHQTLFKTLKEIARQKNLKTALLTFQNHPLEIIKPEISVVKLTQKEEKLGLLTEIGFDAIIFPPFTHQIASLSPHDFIAALVKMMPVHTILVGDDVTFGALKAGDRETLCRLGKEFGFEVVSMDPICIASERISSTRIRNLLQQGCLEEASSFLGRPYTLSGYIEKGLGAAAKELGCPTLNMSLGDRAYPREGIYAGYVRLDRGKKWHRACIYIGRAGTLHPREKPLLEVNLLDQEPLSELFQERGAVPEKIYIEVRPERFLRPDQVFASKEELMQQIQKDLTMAKDSIQPQI